jgi:LacI family transcriptional regulator
VVSRIYDVAERAGVSKSTVSRVLNNSPAVDIETRQRVLAAAQSLNYYRNAGARRLARGSRSDFFGLLISDIENPVFPEMIKSFEIAAAAEGYDLFLCATNYDRQRTALAVRKMIENAVRGVAIMTSSAMQDVALEFAGRRIPVVGVDFEAPQRNIRSITIDYDTGVREAIRHLVELGHRRIAFISGSEERRSARKYRDTLVAAARASRLTIEETVESDQTLEGGRVAALKVVRSRKITAYVCINDLTAIGAMDALRDRGIRVPEDISVLGSEDIYMARFVNPALTTVRLDRKALGALAFRVLQSMSRKERSTALEDSLTTSLVIRESTGKVSETRRGA